MHSSRSRALLLTALAALAVTFQASGQAVISTHSGVVHYFEGAVYLNDQPIQLRLGRFLSVPEGGELRTEEGRAEVLLTPGVFLRIDRNSAIRMVSSSLDDSRVELLAGSAMVESAEPAPGTAVALSYRDWQVRFPARGVYRIDAGTSDPARVWVREGEAEVTDPATGNAVAVTRGMDLPLAAALAPEQSFDEPRDALSNWSRGRADSISADDQIAANIQDPGSMTDSSMMGDPGQAGFTQFPMLGLAPINPVVVPGISSPYSVGVYSSIYPYQPGFYSLYLPGYTYRPLFLALPSQRVPTVYSPLPRVGSSTLPRPVYGSPAVVRPVAPIVHPAATPVAHPAAPAHAVGHPH
jgi:hypothetical protein